jgi:hypothetical protein
MASLPWFRFYSEFAGDPVMQSLAFEDQRHFVMVLCLKCNGTLDRDLPAARRDIIICRGLGLDPATAAEVKRRLQEVDLIDKNWQPRSWDKRQYASDVSTKRVRKYRKDKDTGNVTPPLPKQPTVVAETHQNRPEQNRLREEDFGKDFKGGFDVQTRIVAGGFKQIGAGKRIKNPRRADEAMRAYLASQCGLSDLDALNMVSAARDPTAAGHHDARRFCLQVSLDNKLGWFGESAA